MTFCLDLYSPYRNMGIRLVMIASENKARTHVSTYCYLQPDLPLDEASVCKALLLFRQFADVTSCSSDTYVHTNLLFHVYSSGHKNLTFCNAITSLRNVLMPFRYARSLNTPSHNVLPM
jgi:hypothetical protein